MRRLSVWTGTAIGPYQSVAEVAEAIERLVPPGRWARQWVVKAGEDGYWQRELGDRSPLAIDGPETLAELCRAGQRLRPRLRVVPYVVVGGWRFEEEVEQIAQCAAVAGVAVINLEPGEYYWRGPLEPQPLNDWYIGPLWNRIAELTSRRVHLRLCTIPRAWVVQALGGAETMRAWFEGVNSVTWECYGLTAEDLRVDVAIPRMMAMFPDHLRRAAFRVPVVEAGEVLDWAETGWARGGLEVWHLGG